MKPLASLRPQLPLVAALLCGVAVFPTNAHADEKEACVAASDQAQTFRDDGKYRQARAALLTCARDVCPGIVRKDCEKWLGDLDSLQPTVVIGARDPKGRDIVDVRVFIDGNKIVDRLNGKPMQVDPGDHIFRYESPGVAVLEEHVVVRVGEKNRFLTAQLKPLTGEISAPSAPPPPPTPPGEPAPEEGSSMPIVAYTIGGLGVFALGSFTFFGITGKSDVSDLRGSCAPNCAQKDVDAAKTKLLIADISLGIGVVAIGTAAVLLLTRGSSSSASSASSHVDVRAVPGGGYATFAASF